MVQWCNRELLIFFVFFKNKTCVFGSNLRFGFQHYLHLLGNKLMIHSAVVLLW